MFKMIEEMDPKITDRAPVRCEECDREMEHYNTFVTPTNERRNVCWECLSRQEKGFFAHRGFHRGARNGDIPR
ncbi:MAG: hypothetical protein ABJB34_09265 [Acidobacteriota bacterium]